jgi:hypothetical protein
MGKAHCCAAFLYFNSSKSRTKLRDLEIENVILNWLDNKLDNKFL